MYGKLFCHVNHGATWSVMIFGQSTIWHVNESAVNTNILQSKTEIWRKIGHNGSLHFRQMGPWPCVNVAWEQQVSWWVMHSISFASVFLSFPVWMTEKHFAGWLVTWPKQGLDTISVLHLSTGCLTKLFGQVNGGVEHWEIWSRWCYWITFGAALTVRKPIDIVLCQHNCYCHICINQKH